MAYSHARLRKTLALVRIITGVIFVVFGTYKISSMEFARVRFPQFLYDVSHGAAVSVYGSVLNSLGFWLNPGKYALLVGFTELFIGIGLLLGLVVRPIALLGMMYAVNLMLATWMAPGPDQPLWRYLDGQMRHIALFLLFLLFGMGHAGETWGLGALYHRRRLREEEEKPPLPPAEVFESEFGGEPSEEDEEGLPASAYNGAPRQS